MISKNAERAAWTLALLAGLALGAIAGRTCGVHGPAAHPDRSALAQDHDHDHDHDHHGDPDGGGGAEVTYICPMHPQIRQPHFGTCPICFMDLVAVSGEDDGIEAVRPSDEAAARAGLRTTTVQRVPLHRELRVVGRLESAENAEIDLSAWFEGRIDHLHVRATGEHIRRGQPIARVYSPRVYNAQHNLIQARVLRDQAGDNAIRLQTATHLLDAARQELRLLGIPPTDIRRMEALEAPEEVIELRATASGVVRRRAVQIGDWVQTGSTLYELVALDTLWAQLDIWERDLPHVQVGAPVTLYLPQGSTLHEGTISFLDPNVDPQRRTVRARVALPNEGGRLRPGQWIRGAVHLSHPGQPLPLSLPTSAVLWAGPKAYVYVLDAFLNPPGFVAAEVRLGERWDSRWEILDGVFETETVAAEATFRLDSSLQIRGGQTMMQRGEAPNTGGGHGH